MNTNSIAPENKIQLDELSEDMKMAIVGPGEILSEARKKISLSVEDVAKKLNFKTGLVDNIERDLFDQKLPATYNRGYLRSYAKLVNVNVDDVIAAYDLLDVAEAQRSEMQSFSNLTEKQAEHSRLMWLSYFIAAILFGLMILWWQQEPKQTADDQEIEKTANSILQDIEDLKKNKTDLAVVNNKEGDGQLNKVVADIQTAESDVTGEKNELLAINNIAEQEVINTSLNDSTNELIASMEAQTNVDNILTETMEPEPALEISTAVFTFSGDCWVNIYDASGERIAWGIKKSGYVMSVEGVAPLEVTLGKPELAIIEFNGQLVDLSGFNAGNIAKFTLPLAL